MKTCSNKNCLQVNPQPLKNFGFKHRYKDNINSQCKSCSNLAATKSRRKNPQKQRDRDKKRYYEDPVAARQKSRGCRFRQKYWPHLSYKEALAEWDRMFTLQEGKCAICDKVKPLDVEHDHDTGEVRSLSCNGCNTALARIEEDFDIVLKLAKYIQKHKKII